MTKPAAQKWKICTRCLGLAATIFALTACDQNPDPASGGFFNAVRGFGAQTYEGRIDALEQELSRVRRALNGADAENKGLQEEAMRLQTEIDRFKRELAENE